MVYNTHFKKKDRENVENHRPVSILPVLSKVYERCMYDQMYVYLNKILSKWQCGFCQGNSTEHCFLMMIEKWLQCLDEWGDKWSIWFPHTFSFNCQTWCLWFLCNFLVFTQSYLSERQQRTKVNNAYSTYSDILYGVPQVSILGPLLYGSFQYLY